MGRQTQQLKTEQSSDISRKTASNTPALSPAGAFKDNVKRRLSRFSYGTRLSFSSLDEDTNDEEPFLPLQVKIETPGDQKPIETPSVTPITKPAVAPIETPIATPPAPNRPAPIVNTPIAPARDNHNSLKKSLIDLISSSKKPTKRTYAEHEEMQELKTNSTQVRRKRKQPYRHRTEYSESKLNLSHYDRATGLSSNEPVFFPRELWHLQPEGFSDTQLHHNDQFELTIIQITSSYDVTIETGSETVVGVVMQAQTFSLEVRIDSLTLFMSQWETFRVLPHSSCSITNHGKTRAKVQLVITKPLS